MSSDPAVSSSLAAAEKRLEEMAMLSDIFSGQIKRQRRELQAIHSALACPCEQEGRDQVSAGDIPPAMLG